MSRVPLACGHPTHAAEAHHDYGAADCYFAPGPSDLKAAILFLLLFRGAFFLRRLCGLLLRFLLPVHTLTHGISPFDNIFFPWPPRYAIFNEYLPRREPRGLQRWAAKPRLRASAHGRGISRPIQLCLLTGEGARSSSHAVVCRLLQQGMSLR